MTSGSAADALGGEVDALWVDLAALNREFGQIQTNLSDYSAVEIIRMHQELALFRVWETVSHARLRMFEQNAGLAVDDIDEVLAQSTVF